MFSFFDSCLHVVVQKEHFVLLTSNDYHYADFLSQSYMTLLIHNVLHLHDLNIMLQVAVVISGWALLK